MFGLGNFVCLIELLLSAQLILVGQTGGELAAQANPAADLPPAAAEAAQDPGAGEAAAEVAPGGLGLVTQFLSNPFNLILISAILFMFIVVRPQQKQMKALQKSLAELKKNDRVVTASGIHGTVVQMSASEPTVMIRIDESSGARMTVNRDAIAKILNTDTKSNS